MTRKTAYTATRQVMVIPPIKPEILRLLGTAAGAQPPTLAQLRYGEIDYSLREIRSAISSHVESLSLELRSDLDANEPFKRRSMIGPVVSASPGYLKLIALWMYAVFAVTLTTPLYAMAWILQKFIRVLNVAILIAAAYYTHKWTL